tara:strand:- start:268 stop:1362 length:1095 start_codon:yes stop_codon:yes gene_type:complete
MSIPPTKIAEDISNNYTYWLFTADASYNVTDMKHIAQLNNFNFVNNIDNTILASNGHNVINAMISINEPSDFTPIFVYANNGPKIMYYQSSDKTLLTTESGGDDIVLSNDMPLLPAGDAMASHAIFIKQNDDKTSKFDLLETQIKQNIITADNQHTALQFIYIFLIVISILSLMFNFDKIKISHIVFLLFFICYGVFYKYISTLLVMQFKDAIGSIKNSDSVNQLIIFIKLICIATSIFVVPLLTLIFFNTPYDAPLSDVTDYTKTVVGDVVGDVVDYGSEFVENSQNVINEGVSTLSDGVGDIQNNIKNSVDGVSQAVGDIGEKVSGTVGDIGETVTNSASNLQTRFRMAQPGSSTPQPSTAP